MMSNEVIKDHVSSLEAIGYGLRTKGFNSQADSVFDTSKHVAALEARAAEAERQRDELLAIINTHNAELASQCARNRQSEFRCADYARIGEHKRCPDCTLDYQIDLPAWAKGK